MSRIGLSCFVGALILASPSVAAEKSSWVGKDVIVKDAGTKGYPFAEATDKGGPVLSNTAYEVREERNGRVSIRHGGKLVWLDKAAVMLADEAIDHFTAVLFQNPRDARAFLCRGTAFYLDDKYDRALTDLDHALRLEPRNAEMLRRRGKVFIELGDYSRAEADFEAAVAVAPAERCFTLCCRAGLWLAEYDYDRALEDLNESLRLEPGYIYARILRAEFWSVRGEYDKALGEYNELLRSDPKDADVFRDRGETYQRMEDQDRAIADFTEAIRLRPDDSLAFINRAKSWREKADAEKTLADFDKAIQLDPRSGNAFTERAVTFLLAGELDRARADFDKAIQVDPRNVYPLQMRAGFRASQGECEVALADCNEAIRLEPSNPSCYEMRVFFWITRNKFDEALADCNEAIRLASQRASGYGIRAGIWMTKGAERIPDALSDYETAICLEPNNAEPYTNRAALRYMLNEYDEAIADCNEAIRLNPKDTKSPLLTRGRSWLAKKEYNLAMADFNEVINIDPDYQEAYSARSDVWQAKKQYAWAIVDLNREISLSALEFHGYADLAWLLATCPDARFRDGKKALEVAQSGYRAAWSLAHPRLFDALAAAYAEIGEFELAVIWQQKGIEVAEAATEFHKGKLQPLNADPYDLDKARIRLRLYQDGKPYHGE